MFLGVFISSMSRTDRLTSLFYRGWSRGVSGGPCGAPGRCGNFSAESRIIPRNHNYSAENRKPVSSWEAKIELVPASAVRNMLASGIFPRGKKVSMASSHFFEKI